MCLCDLRKGVRYPGGFATDGQVPLLRDLLSQSFSNDRVVVHNQDTGDSFLGGPIHDGFFGGAICLEQSRPLV